MKSRTTRVKRKEEPLFCIKKKLRSRLNRRRRTQISPISSFLNRYAPSENYRFSSFSDDSSMASYVGGEVSGVSSKVSGGLASQVNTNLRNRKFGGAEVSKKVVPVDNKVFNAPFRRITRSYYKKSECPGNEYWKEAVGSEAEQEPEPEPSEMSCVESNSCANFDCIDKRSSNVKTEIEVTKRSGGNEGSDAFPGSEISCVEQLPKETSDQILKISAGDVKFSSNNCEDDIVSLISGLESCSETNFACSDDYAKLELRNVHRNYNNANCDVLTSVSAIGEPNLACQEQFSYEELSENSSSQVLSELQSENFLDNSDLEFLDYTPSIFFDSGSEFSERSIGDLTPSPTFSLLLKFREEFQRSTNSQDNNNVSCMEEEYKDKSAFLRFENEEDEESYQMLRDRERRQVLLSDCPEYFPTAEDGDLILQQRSQMVHWIVTLFTDSKLHHETVFLGVSLFDRFLSKGFFNNKRNLQILGIASLTLATRIEENQPYNNVRRKNFNVGGNVYNRCEVVAMEWMVEEVLDFNCFLPTVYNFLWFYLKAAEGDAHLEKRTRSLAVLVLSDDVHIRHRPSTIAAALVILASLESNQDSTRQRVIETHVRTKSDDLHACIESLEWLLRFI